MIDPFGKINSLTFTFTFNIVLHTPYKHKCSGKYEYICTSCLFSLYKRYYSAMTSALGKQSSVLPPDGPKILL